MNIITEYTIYELLERRRAEAREQRLRAQVLRQRAAHRSPSRHVRLAGRRSASVRERHLINAYRDAWREWHGSVDAQLWDTLTADKRGA